MFVGGGLWFACSSSGIRARRLRFAIITLPLGHPHGLLVMRYQGVNCQNIMSLGGGSAIAIRAHWFDAAVGCYDRERGTSTFEPGLRLDTLSEPLQGEAHWRVIGEAAVDGRAGAVLQPLIIHPVFLPRLHPGVPGSACSARLPSPKTYAMGGLPPDSRSPWYRC